MYSANTHFAEAFQVVSAFVPVDLQSGANTGDWVSLKGYESITFVFFKAAGTAGDDPVITVQEATAIAGTAAQDLVAIDTVYLKQGTQTGVGQFTQVTQTAAATYTNATWAEAQAVAVITINADKLSEGFDCINFSVADVGSNAQLGCGLYILGPARYGKVDLNSAIID